MNKLLFIVFLIFSVNFSHADTPNKNESVHRKYFFGFDTGILGIGFSYAPENNFAFDFSANLLNIYMEDTTSFIGIEFTPLNYSYSSHTNEHVLSFTKLYIYWNVYEFLTRNHPYKGILWFDGDSNDRRVFGPFFSIQTSNFSNFENFNTNVCYSAGIKLSKKSLFGNSNVFSIFSSNVEIGYRYNNERHSVYFNIGLSPAGIVLTPVFLFMALAGGF